MRGLAAPRASSALSPPGAVLGWAVLCWAAATPGPAAPAARPGRRGAGRVPSCGGGRAVVLREEVGAGAAVGLCLSPLRSRSSPPYLVSVPSPSVRLHCLGAIGEVMVPAAFLPGASRAVISAPPLGMPRSSHGTYYSASVS